MSPSSGHLILNQARVPDFDVQIAAPDITPWLPGNIGLPGFTSLRSPTPGPHVAILALTHGNEIAGGIVLDRLLRQGIRPSHGTLTIGFVNLAAFARFDPAQPTASRFVDEDINRVWDEQVLSGPRRSSELDRARQIRPLIDSVDLLLDLHSMLWPSDPLMLCGATAKGQTLARSLAEPDLIVADHGHLSGKRLIDYGHFADLSHPAAANLIEAGQHWLATTVTLTETVVLSLLAETGITNLAKIPHTPTRKIATVTHAITAATASFAFVQTFRGGDCIEKRNTLIALDGTTEIRTPYDNCLLVMPSLRPSRGHTAVRLARFIDP